MKGANSYLQLQPSYEWIAKVRKKQGILWHFSLPNPFLLNKMNYKVTKHQWELERIKVTFHSLHFQGKNFVMSDHRPGHQLSTLCARLRSSGKKARRKLDKDVQSSFENNKEVYDLLEGLLDLNPLTRITAEQALKHPFFAQS